MLELLEFSEASRFHNRLVLAGVSREREREREREEGRKGGREGGREEGRKGGTRRGWEREGASRISIQNKAWSHRGFDFGFVLNMSHEFATGNLSDLRPSNG